MQKTDEKLRKAEEIYYRRNGIKYRGENIKKQSHSWNLIVLIIIVLGIYLYKNNTIIMNENMKNQIRNFLNTPIKFNNIIDFVKEKKKEIEESIYKSEKNKYQTNGEEIFQQDIVEPADLSKVSIQNTEEKADLSGISTKDKEAGTDIKNDIIWPYKGEITSGFGERISGDPRVSSNHEGVDIAGNERRGN